MHQPLCRDIFRIFCIIRPIHVTKWKQSRNADKQTIDEAKKRRLVDESNIVDPPKSGTGFPLRRLSKYKRNISEVVDGQNRIRDLGKIEK